MSTPKKLTYLIGLLILSSHDLSAAESLVTGLSKSYPVACSTLGSIVATDKSLFRLGLVKARPIANLVLTNSVSNLDSKDPVKIFASDFSGTLKSVSEHLDTKSKEYQDAFIESFPGSCYDRSIRESLDELRVLANLHPGLRDKEEYRAAYNNIEEMASYLGLNAATVQYK